MKNVPAKPGQVPIGRYFVESGIITSDQLEEALEHKRKHGLKLGQALVATEAVTEGQLSEALRRQGKIHCVNLRPELVNTKLAAEFGEKMSRKYRAVVVNRIAGYTTVAMEDPADIYAIDEMGLRLDSRIHAVYAEPTKIDQVIDHVFKEARLKVTKLDQAGAGGDGAAKIAIKEEKPTRGLKSISLTDGGSVKLDIVDAAPEPEEEDEEEDLDQPVINLVRSVLKEAFLQGASDIHIEPRRKDLLVRFRVDGMCYDRVTVPKSWARPVLARLKVMAQLDIAQRRLPQDGRTQFLQDGQRVDLRIATTPSLHGEAAVLRILDGGRELQDLESLDLDENQRKSLNRIITCREGFVLATGPTGSGKTTTLYAILKELHTTANKIITLEDPVENELEGVTQINANPKIGLTFAAGLRSILRQDPDVILLGEIRDQETAQIAVQASLTGRIVLSTLHTVGAVESITRMSDMGIVPYLVADTLRGIVAQRLLRRICEGCKRPIEPDSEVLEELGIDKSDAVFYRGIGCTDCRDTGFKGRVAIFEVLHITSKLSGLIQRGASSDELYEAALAEGLVTLREDALRKARQGATTLKEVLSATNRS